MFDFISNKVIRIVLEISMSLITAILGFLGGIKYNKKINEIGNIKNSDKNEINQVNK